MHNFFLKRICLIVIFSIIQTISFAQDTVKESGEIMRSHDKIYVVMTVCLVILIVMLLYLVRIDLKVSRKEKNG